MLKLIYTETDVHIELLTANLEDWIEQRLLFSNSTGEITFLSSGTARKNVGWAMPTLQNATIQHYSVAAS
jgi:hypothetical protein